MNIHDEQILKDYTWSAYCQVPESLKSKLEATLLTEIVGSSDGQLNDDFLSWKKCAKLLDDNESLRSDLLKGWERRCFDSIRNSDLLQRKRSEVTMAPEPSSQTVNIYGANLTEIHGDLISYESNDDENIKKWLCERDYREIQRDLSSKRVNNTGTWFLKSPEFGKWANNDEFQILWCPGMPGVGKTVISCLTVDYLHDVGNGVVCFIYFNYKRHAEQNLAHVLVTIIRQLFEQNPSQATPVRSLYRKYNSKTSSHSVGDLVEVVKQMLSNHRRAYLILDALDEFMDKYSDEVIATLIQRLVDITPHLKIFATSRVLGKMESLFSQLKAVRLEIISTDKDIDRCLQAHINDKLSFVRDHSQTIIDRIMEIARGRILLAILHLNSMSHLLSWGEVLDALDSLPDQIDLAYERVMERINGQDELRRRLAHRILLWVACAKEALTLRELQHAVAAGPKRSKIQNYVHSLDTISSVCAGLIVIEPNGHVRFIHETAQNFFNNQHERYLGDADSIILETCYYYFSPFSIEDLAKHRVDSLEYPLAHYIAQYWYSHLIVGEQSWLYSEAELDSRMVFIYQCLYLASRTIFLWDRNSNPSWTPRIPFLRFTMFQPQVLTSTSLSNIHLAAACDLPHTLRMLLDAGNSPAIITNEYHQYSVLEIAVEFGALRASKLLIQEARCKGEWKKLNHGRLLALAAKSGMHDFVMELLKEVDLNINARDPHDQTALMNATLYCHFDTARLLLEQKNVDLNACSKNHPSTVLEAAFSCREKGEAYNSIILSILLDHRFDISAGPAGFVYMKNVDLSIYRLVYQKYRSQFLAETGFTLLTHAAIHGNQEAVQDIIRDTPDEIDQVGHARLTPLVCAVVHGRLNVASYLLKCDPRPNTEFRHPIGDTCLALAVRWGQTEMAQTLITCGADKKVRIESGKTLLHLAISCPEIDHRMVWGDRRIEQLATVLLEHGVEVDDKDDSGQTPLFLAAIQGSKILLEVLIRHGADIHAVDNNLRTPLSYAVGTSDSSRLQNGHPHKFLSQRRWAAICLLLEKGANLNAKEKDNMTLLQQAELTADELIVKCLRQHVDGRLPSEVVIAPTEEEESTWKFYKVEDPDEIS